MIDPRSKTQTRAPDAVPPPVLADEDDVILNGPDALDADRRRLAERLRETREFLGLSQQDAAEASGLTRLVISAIETGRRKVESVELGALARVYGQPISYFLPTSHAEAPPEEVQFIARAATELAPSDRAELLRFAEFLRSYKAPRNADSPTPEE